MKTDLSTYNNDWYQPGNPLKRLCWYIVNALFFVNPLNPSSGLKVFLLRMFGSKVGKGVVIKPGVNIKYPWKLTVGDFSWIGEKVWIDNLAEVAIGSHVCISQEAMLLCGNHNYKRPSFDLIVGNITVENGAWVGAKSIICPGVVIKEHCVLSVNSVATKDLEPFGIYQGNPAVLVRNRMIE